MGKWFFPSRGYGELEGFSNPGLEMFKGEPIRAMAREVCQNSLDAKLNNEKPLRLEFQRYFINTADFPGIIEMRNVLNKCRDFWRKKGDEKTLAFVNEAIKTISGEKFFVLRISDFNTTGLKGAFDEENITPWKGLVQGNAFSIKTSNTAAGSFGIGKAAPFVVSKLQTVFYRTFDENGVRAAQGVTHLVSFNGVPSTPGEDPVRRSTGYFSDGDKNKPLARIEQLDALNLRNQCGTDLFIPGFDFTASKAENWIDDIIIELLENFLYSIYSGKMEVVIDDKHLNKSTVEAYINRYMPKTKNAESFYKVIREDNADVTEEILDFHAMGTLRLRLLYSPDANKKVLVVRNSGMKISDIPSLPRGISFVGFLELQGSALNEFFRKMENPQHNKWEHNRHPNPTLARSRKEEVENWVKNVIGEKIKEISGEEIDIDVSNYFFSSNRENHSANEEKVENVVDTVKTIEISQDTPEDKRFKVKDVGGTMNNPPSSRMRSGTIDDQGSSLGHRHRTGHRKGATPTGRMGYEDDNGKDTVYEGMREVFVSARIIKKSSGLNRLIFIAEEDISQGELEIVTVGENGKPLQLKVKQANGIDTSVQLQNGHIVVFNVEKGKKHKIDFEIIDQKNYAMGVRAYGN